jgi:serine/threonine-protein kinase
LQRIGAYEVRGELGRGGMGVVYLGFDPRLDREVAIKMLPTELAQDAVARERFVNEARSAARLQHPNILPVYDVGEVDGRPYLVMLRVHGADLATRLTTRGRWTVAEAEPLLRQLSAAIDTAHAHGVVHRDIKPENVLIEDGGQAMLTDFGIARVSDSGGRGLTRTGMILGTPEYMSPEQAAGHAIDHRADLYSLGVLVYRLLTGAVPFTGDTAISVALQHLREPAPDPCQAAPELSPGAAAAVLRMLAKQPADRYDTACQFVEALVSGTETFTGRQTPLSPAAPTPALTAPPAVPTRAQGALPALVVLLLLGGLVLVLAGPGGQRPEGPTRPPVTSDPPPPPPPVPVPNVTGMGADEGTQRLREAGLKVERTEGEDESAEPGTIIAQRPSTGQVDQGATIHVVVCKASDGDPPVDPMVAVITRYHASISRHDFAGAWSCFTTAKQNEENRPKWEAGFAPTAESRPSDFQVIERGDAAGSVQCTVSYRDTDGSTGSVEHLYRLARGADGWRIARIKAVH